jgi:hypothetical protein
MKRTVRVIVRDFPKRTNSFRATVEVEAQTDDEALSLGRIEAAKRWPNGKIIAYDVDRILSHQIEPEKRPTLKAKGKAA